MMEKPMKKTLRTTILMLISVAGLLAADQLSKYLVEVYLKPVKSVTVIPHFLELSYLENTGAAFGLFQGQTWLLALVTAAAFAVILVLLFRYRRHSFFSLACAALVLAGGLGNLLDRFLRGYVIDFFHVLFFGYIFNFADCCITVSAVLFLIHVFFFTGEKPAKEGEAPQKEQP